MEFIEEFKSINEMLKVIAKRKQNHSMRYRNSSTENSYDFTGTNSYEEAEELFKNGDKEKYEMIQKEFRSKVNNVRTNLLPRRQVRTGVVGYAPNVPNAIMGLPNSMIYTDKVNMKSKTVSILYSITGNCYIEAKEFIKSGVAVLDVVNSLELSGYRVEVKILFFNAKECDEKLRGLVTVKNYNEHLDLLKMAFPLANPSMFRRFGFKWLETCPVEIKSDWAYGYGSDNSREDLTKGNIVYLNLDRTKECSYNSDGIIKNYFQKFVNL